MRPLTLHVSALSDSEYDLYTTSLSDLASDTTDTNTTVSSATHVRDDAYYERTSVGVREARAWLRGRYPDLPASDIDAILRLFCPNMLPSDTLSGGQFFAAFRLVVHAMSGKGVDRTLAFVQACVTSPKSIKSLDAQRPPSPPKRVVQAPPSHPERQKAPPFAAPHPETNPFTRKSMEQAPVPVQVPDPAGMPVHLRQRSNKLSHNPFLARDRPDAGVDKPLPPSTNTLYHGKLPPLPPRKPSLLAAPSRRPPEVLPTPITSTANLMAPLVPTKPTHVMSPLMKQSLEASKHAQSMKRAEEQLDRERVLQVLKTTSSSSSVGNAAPSTRTRSLSPTKQLAKLSNGRGPDAGSAASDDATYVPPLPRRRKPSMPSSTSSSVLSLEQVASAKLPSPVGAPLRPPLPSRDMRSLGVSTAQTDSTGLPFVAGPASIPPPTHPRRRPSISTEPTVDDPHPSPPSSPRISRSKSVTTSSSAPLPPPRRKRPESMQLTPTSDLGDLPSFPPAHVQPHARTASFQGLSRHLSLSRDRERESDSSPIANIQKTLSHLHLKAQPRLDAVRYKAEAGISRRGYIHHGQLSGTRWREEGEQGLMRDTRWAAANVDQDIDSAPTTDDEPSSTEDHDRRTTQAVTNTVTHRDLLTESDHLKWPMGEGWKPL